LEILLEVFEEIADDIEAIVQIHNQIFGYWEEVVRVVRHNDHLRLLEGAPEVEVVHIFVIGEEADACSVTSWQRAFVKDAFDR